MNSVHDRFLVAVVFKLLVLLHALGVYRLACAYCLLASFAISVLVTPVEGADSDAPFQLTRYTQADSRLGLNAQPDGQPLVIAGKTYEYGISTGTIVMEFELTQECKSFHAEVGMTEGANRGGQFLVLLDEAIFYRGGATPGQPATSVELPCQGISKITLVSRAGDNNNRAIWANARIETEQGRTVYLADALKRQGKLPWNHHGLRYPFGRLLGRVDPEPETKTVSEVQGKKVIERDWLMQAEGECLGERALAEIGWARQMAARILKTADSEKKAHIDAELERLADIERRLLKATEDKAQEPDVQKQKDLASLTQILGTSIYRNADISVPVDNGIYKIQLLIYEGWGGSHGRAADISVEGKRIAHNYNYWTQQGQTPQQGSLISHSAEITDGQIDISMKGTVPGIAPHMSGLIISRAQSIAPATFSLLEKPERLDLANVVKAINFGVTGNQAISGTTFSHAGANSTVAGVKNNARGQVRIGGSQSIPTLGAKKAITLAHRADYNAVRACKRIIMFLHPAIDFSEILMVDAPYASGRQWMHESRMRAGFMGTPGGRLLVLDGLSPSGELRKLAPQGPPAAFRRPDLSYDGKRVLFCMNVGSKASCEKNYNLYEINIDGAGLRQLTSSKYDDIDPVYLPDGNIAFLTSRANVYAGCGPWAPQHTMARCDQDGKNIYLLSVGSEAEFSPSVLNDGRLIYTRWEYNDKELNRIQSLWTMNLDGTMSSAYWGNQSPRPDHIGEARSIPGSSLVVFSGLGHHDMYSGSIGVIDVNEGNDYPHGLYKVTQYTPWGETGGGGKAYCNEYHGSGKLKRAQYKCPYPLSEDLFLVSARTVVDNRMSPYAPMRTNLQPSYFRLYLMDKFGNHELIYSGAYNILYAQPVRKRYKPQVTPSMVKWPGSEEEQRNVVPGVLYSPDVYEGLPEQMRGKAKYLRVIEAVQRVFSTGCVHGGGSPFGSDRNIALDCINLEGVALTDGNPQRTEIDLTYGDGAILAGPATGISANTRLKRVLGTVPIADDGSFFFEAPPGKAIYFQLLDENHLVLQSMRSWVNLMPGERRACVGCHEGQMNAPPTGRAGSYARMPDQITPPSWGVKTLSYVEDIQPIFDKNCAECHQGKGKARAKLDLTLRPDKENRWGGIFPEPYITLVCGSNRVNNSAHFRTPSKTLPTIAGNFFVWASPHTTIPPMTRWSYKSPLINMHLHGKHNDVKLTAEEMGKLIVWVDTNCHYRSLKDVLAISDPDPNWFVQWPYPPRLKSAPYVNHLYAQDEFSSPSDRATLRSRYAEARTHGE